MLNENGDGSYSILKHKETSDVFDFVQELTQASGRKTLSETTSVIDDYLDTYSDNVDIEQPALEDDDERSPQWLSSYTSSMRYNALSYACRLYS